MVGRSVENEIEIMADIKTRALLSRGSTDIYADICTVYVSNSMSFSTVCRQVRDFSAGVRSVTSTPTPGRVAQSVTCLAIDACLTADPGVASSIPARSHTFVEIDHEIISTVILLPSSDSFKKGCCQLQAKVCAQITG